MSIGHELKVYNLQKHIFQKSCQPKLLELSKPCVSKKLPRFSIFDDHQQALAKHQTKKEMLLQNKKNLLEKKWKEMKGKEKKLKSSGVSYTIAIDYHSFFIGSTLIILFTMFSNF